MSKPVIIYDFNVLPEFGSEKGDYAIMMEVYSKDKIILWDSTKGTPGVNCEPKVILSEDDTDIPLKIQDVSGVVKDRVISAGEKVEKPFIDSYQLQDTTTIRDILDYLYLIMGVHSNLKDFEFYIGFQGFLVLERIFKTANQNVHFEMQRSDYGDPGIRGKAMIPMNKKNNLILYVLHNHSETTAVLPSGTTVNSYLLTLKI